MDKNLLKYIAFVTVVEQGSFTKASERLQYSQSGISRMLQDLEKEWNVVLLERNKNGVQLTGEGAKLLFHAREIVGAYEKLKMEVDALHGRQSGFVRIGTFSSVATHFLPKVIQAAKAKVPLMEYELLLGDYLEIEEWLTTGRVELGFLRLPTEAKLDTIFLLRDDFMAILPEGHRYAECPTVPLALFCEEPFLLLEKGENREISEIFTRHGLTPHVQYTTWDDYAVMSMVESGLGIGILPRLILQRIPYHIVVKPLCVPAYRDIGVAMRDKTHLSLAASSFLTYVVGE